MILQKLNINEIDKIEMLHEKCENSVKILPNTANKQLNLLTGINFNCHHHMKYLY